MKKIGRILKLMIVCSHVDAVDVLILVLEFSLAC